MNNFDIYNSLKLEHMHVWFKYFRWIWCILLNLFNIAHPTHIFITVYHSSDNNSMMGSSSHSLSMVSPYFHNLIMAKHVWQNSHIRQQNCIFWLHHWCHYDETTYPQQHTCNTRLVSIYATTETSKPTIISTTVQQPVQLPTDNICYKQLKLRQLKFC